jgi:hypothetical protein
MKKMKAGNAMIRITFIAALTLLASNQCVAFCRQCSKAQIERELERRLEVLGFHGTPREAKAAFRTKYQLPLNADNEEIIRKLPPPEFSPSGCRLSCAGLMFRDQ